MEDPEREMAVAAADITEGVAANAAAWVVRVVTELVDAWGRLSANERAAAIADAHNAGERAAARVTGELQTLFAQDVAAQRTTPLAIVRTLRVEATEVLARAGVPEVVRDEFDVRSFPDDVYGIVPREMGALGDSELRAKLLVWGLGKANVLRARSRDNEGS